MSAWLSSWRASVRIARREVFNHRARNTLIVAMLALPVFGAGVVDTVTHSSQRSVQEKLTRELGQSAALVQNESGGALPLYQTPDAGDQTGVGSPSNGGNPQATAGQLQAALAKALPGATILTYVTGFQTKIHTPDGYLFLDSAQLDFTNPATTGMVDLRSGRLPLTSDEIMLSSAAQRQLGTRIGQSVTVPDTSGRFLVVGIADNPDSLQDATVYAQPNALSADPSSGITQWLVVSSQGVSWNTVKQLNATGFLVVSRAVVENPPPKSDVPYYAYVALQQAPQTTLNAKTAAVTAAIAFVVIGLILLEVVLLAGPAFAVSARRREREYAMLGAAGADSTALRRIVLADGLVLGAIAGVVGAALGVGGAGLVMPFMSHFTHVVPGAFQVRPLELLAIAVLAIVLGLSAAYVPARNVARQDILLSLTGRRAPRQAEWKLPAGGLGMMAAGIVAILGGPHESDPRFGSLILVVGVALLEIGAIMCTPVLVGTVARFGRLLPLGPRLALRDGARHRGRTTPAVAAMFAAVAGAVAAGTWFVSSDAQQRAQYLPHLLPNQVAVEVSDDASAASLATQLRTVLPVSDDFTTRAAEIPSSLLATGASSVTATAIVPCIDGNSQAVLLNGEMVLCGPFSGGGSDAFEGAPIGDGTVLTKVTGLSDPAATRMLAQGGVVVFDPALVHDGKVTFDLVRQPGTAVDTKATSSSRGPGSAQSGQTTTTSADVPGVYMATHGGPTPGYVISPAAAKRLGLTGGRESLVFDLSRHISGVELQRANKILAGAGIDGSMIVENGYQGNLGAINLILLAAAVLVAVGAAAIATGLAIADGQPDLETLSAVGGSPATRRLLAGSTALVITGLGALVGIPVGFAVVGGLIQLKSLQFVGIYVGDNVRQGSSMPFVVPWLNVVVAAVGVPLVTAFGAMLLTRSEVRLSRRIT